MDQSQARAKITPAARDRFVAEQVELTHSLNNRLGIILAECAVLIQNPSDPKFLIRLQAIQKVAQAIADDIAIQQRRIAEVVS
jgi:hypothetical protein